MQSGVAGLQASRRSRKLACAGLGQGPQYHKARVRDASRALGAATAPDPHCSSHGYITQWRERLCPTGLESLKCRLLSYSYARRFGLNCASHRPMPWAVPGIEHGNSRTRSKNHTTRPNSQMRNHKTFARLLAQVWRQAVMRTTKASSHADVQKVRRVSNTCNGFGREAT